MWDSAVWCGAPPDTLAPCCILIAAALLWASAALGASLWHAPYDGDDEDPALHVLYIAGVLVAVAHAVPDTAALLLTIIMALHAILIAVTIALDALLAPKRVRAR